MIQSTAPAPAVVGFSAPHYQPYTLVRGDDRCDRCGAEAYVATAHTNGLVLWCNHHFVKNEPALATDPRVKVVANESLSLTVRETDVH